MKFIKLPILYLISITFAAVNAQVSQVSVGAGYSQQAFYSLATGEVTILENDAWDIAFSNNGTQDAGIFINEATGSGEEGIGLFVTDVAEWTDVIIDEGQFADSLKLYNAETNWTEGAFNVNKDPNDPLDYGWGSYNPATNTIEGSAIYVVKLRDGSMIKFKAMSLDLGAYSFRYANLDGSNEVTKIINKITENSAPIIPFSFTTGEEVEIPASFDIIFQRYVTDLDGGDGTTIPYVVTGVLSGPGVEVAEVDGEDPESVMEADYNDTYETGLSVIGHDWKSFDFSQGWLIDEDRTFFVKTKDGSKHKVVFFDFEGSSTGNITFERSDVLSSSAHTLEPAKSDIIIYPNPFAHHVMVENLADTQGILEVYTLAGKLMREISLVEERLVNLSELQAGTYLFRISVEGHIENKVVVKY